jgi:hypothetical protein
LAWHCFPEELQALHENFFTDYAAEACDVAAWPGEARRETGIERVAQHHDGNDGGRPSCRVRHRRAFSDNDLDLAPDKLLSKLREPFRDTVRERELKAHVLAFDPSPFAEPRPECSRVVTFSQSASRSLVKGQPADTETPARLLRLGGERRDEEREGQQQSSTPDGHVDACPTPGT